MNRNATGWRIAAAERNEKTVETNGCYEVFRTYEGRDKVRSWAVQLYIDWENRSEIDSDAIYDIESLMLQFNQLATQHEWLHVENYLATYSDISAYGCGQTLQEAQDMAKNDFERQRRERLRRFDERKKEIDGNGDREQGQQLLGRISDLLGVGIL